MTAFEKEVADVELAMIVRTEWLARRAKFRRENRTGKICIFPEKLESKHKSIIDRELSVRKGLRERSPEEWLQKIEKLPEPEKTRASWIAWWDFFASRDVLDRWHHLDHLINRKCEPVTDGDLAIALNILGYTPYMAVARVKGGDESSEENETQADPAEDQALVTE